ncbi:hypothetical protein KV100_02855 [Mumia sp. zg.B21]|uniref:hypothetical protein n=1 Tax=Mumia sp. zg.B21 TaxID=2855447 RepID=UPI001C6ED316|nr:hypothetical protein [Mumia sp. zg.B21]MBW9208579.1 hypothetical protein [Mumia sp. zg.B21]
MRKPIQDLAVGDVLLNEDGTRHGVVTEVGPGRFVIMPFEEQESRTPLGFTVRVE